MSQSKDTGLNTNPWPVYLTTTPGDFYISLLRSGARHYQDYLSLATEIAGKDISERVKYFADTEAALIISPDEDFKFHSGLPTKTV